MKTIAISVKGGCIQAVYSSDSRIKAEIWDWDNIEEETPDFFYLRKKEIEFENVIESMHQIL